VIEPLVAPAEPIAFPNVDPLDTRRGRMKRKLMTAMVAFAVAAPAVVAEPAAAQRSYARDRTYQANDRYYRQHCGKGNGAVGTIAGGAGGALIGNALGGGAVGTIAGGVGGALLGRHLDKKHTANRNARRNGC
jgi:hypothetical protein